MVRAIEKGCVPELVLLLVELGAPLSDKDARSTPAIHLYVHLNIGVVVMLYYQANDKPSL